MQEKAKEPEIRFAGFTGAWEQRKLGELYEKAGSGGTPNASNASFYMGTIPFLGISDIKGRYITKTAKHISEKGLKSSAAWMVPSGAISLAMYASVGKVGITSVELATSQAFYNMVFASSSLRNFIFSRLEKASDNDEWLPLVSTGTQSNLNADKIKNWCISVPNSNEQKLVGEFFKKLDNLLTLHQRKYEKLLNIKKSMLEKMFPKEGEVVPEIRFKGFTGAWEQRKLGAIVQITMGQSPDGSTYSDTPADYILVQGNADLKNGWVCPRVWTTQKTKFATAGDLIMSVRAPAGSVGKTAYDVVLGRGVASLKGNEFIYQSLVKMDFDGYWKAESTGSTFESLSSDSISTAELYCPSEDEQHKIGIFLSRLDSLLTLHQRKLEMLKNVKQAFLEKMFV